MTFLLSILTWIVNYVRKHWQVVAGIAAIVLVIVFGLVFRSCGKKASIDQEAINKINSANEKERKAELQIQIEKNQDVINTVDNRSSIADVNVIERNAVIAEKVRVVDRKIAEAKQQGRDVTGPELECMLIPDNCQ